MVTNQYTSADTIRLWLERSGDAIPLDIEIYLRVSSSEDPRRHRRSVSPPATPAATVWLNLPQDATYHLGPIASIPPAPLPSSTPPPFIPPPATPEMWAAPTLASPVQNDRDPLMSHLANHWGHVAIYYLVARRHRWKRFIFRFDRQFATINALKSINGLYDHGKHHPIIIDRFL
jgi:hypothetical protein